MLVICPAQITVLSLVDSALREGWYFTSVVAIAELLRSLVLRLLEHSSDDTSFFFFHVEHQEKIQPCRKKKGQASGSCKYLKIHKDIR